ncbi:MAG: FMN-binding negative transcriptional regulator [Candidatus Eremiobacteraeota bacterium]|nr:FMN-binding negative transcriptional regulator [Candidatus Eremiobacteraeota bacterium]
MYVPRAFSMEDQNWASELIERYPFGLLISCTGVDPLTTHLPMYATPRDDVLSLWGHVARANSQAEAILAADRATAVFSGPHAFVSASWYEEPYITVPTWNYTAVYAAGVLRECDPRPVVDALAARFEGEERQAWSSRGLDAAYLDLQLRAIVAFELRIDRLIAKAKLSQNRTAADRQRVIDNLSHSSDPIARDCAAAMQQSSRAVRRRH